MYPQSFSRPRPASHRRTSSLSKSTGSSSLPPIEFPSISSSSSSFSTTNSNLNELASSSLTQSKPPESPPIHHDPLYSIQSSPISPSEGKSYSIQGTTSNNKNKSKTSALGMNFSHSYPLNLNSIDQDRRISKKKSEEELENFDPFHAERSKALLERIETTLEETLRDSERILKGPTFERSILDSKEKEELAEIIETADKCVTEARRDRNTAAKLGQSLLKENVILKAQLESVSLDLSKSLRNTFSELRERPSPSPQPIRHVRTTSISSQSNHNRMSSWGSPLSTSPVRLRNRLSSTASNNSLLASPLKAPPPTGLKSPEQISLNQENYTLSLRVTELEEEKDETERDGKKKIRKLEKDVLALKMELERIEERNLVLEEKTSNFNPMESVGGRKISKSTSRDDLLSVSKSKDETTPTSNKFLGYQTTPTSYTSNLETSQFDTPSKSSKATSNDPFLASTTRRRKPGTPGENFLPPQSLYDSFESPLLPSLTPVDYEKKTELVDSLVLQLQSKIEELQLANQMYEETQEILELNLERALKAQRDAEESTRILEEWMESHEESQLGWKHEPSLIGWKNTIEPGSPIRNHNNSESYQRQRRRQKGKGRQSNSFNNKILFSQDVRTLGSELGGSDWNQYTSDSSSNLSNSNYQDEDEEDDDDSTSAPTTFSQRDMNRREEEELNTSSELFERGSLRYSGTPDNDEYENFSQVINDLPAKWEEEDNELDYGIATSSSNTRKNISKNKELKALGWQGSTEGEGDKSRNFAFGNRTSRREEFSRRQMALERMGLSSTHTTRNRFGYNSSDDEREEEYEMSEYDHIEAEVGKKADYWPVSLRSRYSPRILKLRMVDSAISSIVTVITYIRFFFILTLAIFFALWQGPKKSLGLVDSRRRLQ